MTDKKNKTTLCLLLNPIPKGEFIVSNRAKICYNITLLERESDDSHRGRSQIQNLNDWATIEADGEFNRTNSFFNELQNARVDKQPLGDFIVYQGISYWQFLPSFIWPQFFLATQLIELLIPLFNSAKPTNIEVYLLADSNNSIWIGVVRAVAAHYGAQVIQIQQPGCKFQYLTRTFKTQLRSIGLVYFRNHISRIIFTLGYALRQLMKINKISKDSRETDCKKLICVVRGRRDYQPVPGDPNGKMHDEQFSPLLSALRQRGWNKFIFVDTQDVDQPQLDVRTAGGNMDIQWRQFSSYLGFGLFNDIRMWFQFNRKWHKIKKDTIFLSDFKYMNISLMPALSNTLCIVFHEHVLDCFDMLHIAENIIEKEKPKAVILTYENGPWQRAMIIKAAAFGIPTVGLQHGMVFYNHYDYMHTNITVDPFKNSRGFVVPFITCVWGQAWKDTLVQKGHYPGDAIVVTGHWRYDNIEKMKNIGKTTFEKKFGFQVGKSKLVAVLSAGIRDYDFVKNCCYATAKGHLTTIIKLHPSSNSRPIKEWIEQSGLPNIMFYQGNLPDLLAASDLVICQFSTTVSEAVIFDRPVILTNFTEMSWPDIYQKSRVCLYVTNPDALEESIEVALSDKAVQDRLTSSRSIFIEKYFYQLDGMSANRVAAALDSTMKHFTNIGNVKSLTGGLS